MRALARLLIVLAVVAAGFVGYAWRSPIAPADPPRAGGLDKAMVARGAELAAIGNCVTCHTKAGGAPYAGGRAIDTPFGRIFATNITPDPETGIGRWSEAAFARAMREGVARDGSHLYPAFPYDHLTKATDGDIKAIHAFLMSRQPVTSANPANDLRPPYNIRMLIAGWKLAFMTSGEYRPDNAKSAEWNRGAYLVEGLAHCGACHTPRNWLGAEVKANAYGGGTAEGWSAPALNAASPAAVPWTAERLFEYLRRGHSPLHGVAAGPMEPVVRNLEAVPDADLKAIAAYVAEVAGAPSAERQAAAEKALARAKAAASAQVSRAPAPAKGGAAIYAGACAQCHGESGRSPLSPALNLALSSDVRGPDPANLARVVIHGIEPAGNAPGPRMPGFGAALTDHQIADLIAYVRATFSDRPAFAGVEDAVRKSR